ncbi:MAG TPA: hypothetical protein VMW64_04290 [Dehalococcoidia bacterium]|nr:hypothetical protein [Dehalococcoidia bacterium]
MQESTLVLTYAGMGLAVMMLGLLIFLQGNVIEHPEQQVKLGRRIRTIGTGLFAIGTAYVIGCLTMAMV